MGASRPVLQGTAAPTFALTTSVIPPVKTQLCNARRLDLETVLEASFSSVDSGWNQNEMVFNLAPEGTFSNLRAL